MIRGGCGGEVRHTTKRGAGEGKEILRKKGMAVSLNEGNAGRGTNTGN